MTTHFDDTTGVILAGGRSRRMGRDKATLIWQGEPLFARVHAALRSRLPAVVIAGNRPDLARPDLPCHPDRYPGSALGGICTVLEIATTPWIFVAACDLPDPDPRLIERILAVRGDADAVIPRTPEGLEPVFAAYRKTALPAMHRLLAAGNCRLSDLCPLIRVRYLDPAEFPPGWEKGLTNLNTPADLLRLQTGAPPKE